MNDGDPIVVVFYRPAGGAATWRSFSSSHDAAQARAALRECGATADDDDRGPLHGAYLADERRCPAHADCRR